MSSLNPPFDSTNPLSNTLSLPTFTADAMGVVVNQEVYTVHDVTGTMKQFFRNLPDPLLTHQLYDQFIEAAREWSEEGGWGWVG